MICAVKRMFVHDIRIPTPFALAVQRIATHTSEDSDADWEILFQHRPSAMLWIESIFLDNLTPFTQEERDWWTEQFAEA